MSGLEVVGVVLGVLPVAVKALEGYMSILSSMKHAERNLKALIRDLETEQLRLQTTCELLLDGVAPPSVIDSLIQTPFGPDWKPKFEQQAADMQKAAEELRAKLCLGPDGSTKLTDRLAISRELKRGASFTLKKKDYDGILTKIKTANSVLHELAGQSCNLEPTRRHRSQARLIRLLPYSCVKSHDVCLELEARDVIIVPTDSDNEVAKNFNFHMVMGSHNDATAAKALSVQQQSIRWESIRVKLAGSDEAKSRSTSTTSLPSFPVTTSTSRRSPRGITWAKSLSAKLTRTRSLQSVSASQTCMSASPTQTVAETAQILTVMPTTITGACIPARVSNLCQTVFRSSKALAIDQYGYIADAEQMFELRPLQSQPEARTPVTLRALLGEKNITLPPFDYPQKLKVAVALSVGILHLFSTPWLSNVITLDDVLFFHGENTQPPGRSSESAYQPFVIKPLHKKPPQCQKSGGQPTPRPVNLAVLSLGALLIQVIIGRIVDELEMTGAMDMGVILSKHEAGSRLTGQVLENGGIHYANVVKWCLGSVFEVAGLENDNFCQSFYGAVVAKLEDDAKLTAGG